MRKTIIILTVLVPLAASAQIDDYNPIWHCTGANSGEQFGYNFASISDQNGDGFDDLVYHSWEPFCFG
ncbi:MAG: hypothetical protein H8E46_11190 [FCB group bacterium]|nr:hypothetical protein [FCB group bacterium]